MITDVGRYQLSTTNRGDSHYIYGNHKIVYLTKHMIINNFQYTNEKGFKLKFSCKTLI